MRITKYETLQNLDTLRPCIVKEVSVNYQAEKKMNSCDKIVQMLRDVFHLHLKTEEHVYMLAFNAKGDLLGVFEISHGTTDRSYVVPKDIYTKALLCGATGIVIAHNHPSGDVTPSQEDVLAASALRKAGNLLGIFFADSIVIGPDDYCSLQEMNLIDEKGENL